jgi:hypothetical protein
MVGLGKTGKVRASATASPARSQDSYQRYAIALYRQALLTPDDSALAKSVFRRLHQLIVGPAQQDRRPGLLGGLGHIRASRVLGIHQRDMTVLLRTVLRRLTTSSAAAVEDGDQAGGAAAGR